MASRGNAAATRHLTAGEVDDDHVAKGIAKIEKQLGRAVEKGKLEQSAADEIRGRISTTTGFHGFEGLAELAYHILGRGTRICRREQVVPVRPIKIERQDGR